MNNDINLLKRYKPPNCLPCSSFEVPEKHLIVCSVVCAKWNVSVRFSHSHLPFITLSVGHIARKLGHLVVSLLNVEAIKP